MARGGAICCGLLVATLLAACGYSRTPAPALENPAPPQGVYILRVPAAGVTLQAPRNWTRIDQAAPLVLTLSSGSAVVALWRFVRAQPLPRGKARMSAATQALIGAVQSRQPAVQVVRARVVHLNGVRGVEVNAVERIKGQLRRVRSTHLYAGQEELVLEEYAPVDVFHSVDHAVFSPLRRSLRVTATG